MMGGILTSHAAVYSLPRDPSTIEALISLHKLIKGEEDKALAKVTTSFGEQSVITKGAGKFNAVRTTLDSRLSNGYSYVILAGALGSTASDLSISWRSMADLHNRQ